MGVDYIMGPISGFEDNHINSYEALEKALLELTPKLFFDFYFNIVTNRVTIEVPKQIIDKVKRYIVPRIRVGMRVKVLERGKKHKFLDIFRKEYL